MICMTLYIVGVACLWTEAGSGAQPVKGDGPRAPSDGPHVDLRIQSVGFGNRNGGIFYLDFNDLNYTSGCLWLFAIIWGWFGHTTFWGNNTIWMKTLHRKVGNLFRSGTCTKAEGGVGADPWLILPQKKSGEKSNMCFFAHTVQQKTNKRNRQIAFRNCPVQVYLNTHPDTSGVFSES